VCNSQLPSALRIGIATNLYKALDVRGEAPHAAYLKTFCGPAQGEILIYAMEQALAGGCGAPLAQSGGRAVSGSHHSAESAPAGTEPRAVSQPARTLLWVASTASSMRWQRARRCSSPAQIRSTRRLSSGYWPCWATGQSHCCCVTCRSGTAVRVAFLNLRYCSLVCTAHPPCT
jgi:hypothetical protein